MKRNIFYTLCGFFLLSSCQKEEVSLTSAEGYLSFTGIEIQNQVLTEVKSRTLEESLTVDIYQGGTKIRTLTPEELENTIKLEASTDYSLKVYSENYGSDAEWTNEEKGEPIYYNRVIAVGTTSVRTLESASENGKLLPKSGDTQIFIRPGYKWQMVDALITNFHLPGSTLVMLVSALYDRERILDAYRCAVEEQYRFFSFGDAMFIE